MNHYSADTIDTVTDFLVQAAGQYGISGIALNEQNILPLEVAFDCCGPALWVMTIHLSALDKLTGIAKHNEINALPIMLIANPESPLQHEVSIQPSKMPMSVMLNYLDAALEHAIAIGIASLGYTHDEWADLPTDQQVIPLMPYIHNVQEHWATVAVESGDTATIVGNFPSLYNKESPAPLQETAQPSHLNFPSMRA